MTARIIATLFAVASIASARAPSIAGTTGQLIGTIHNLGHVPVAGATVTVESPAQQERSVSDSAGSFSFISLAPGTYTVTVGRFGYVPTHTFVYVAADASQRLTVRLEPRLRVVSILSATPDGALIRRYSLIEHVTMPNFNVVPTTGPFYSFDGTSINGLRFVPGLAFGAGPVLSQ